MPAVKVRKKFYVTVKIHTKMPGREFWLDAFMRQNQNRVHTS